MRLQFDQLRKEFSDTAAFNIPALVIETGEFFTFAGPAKSGKTTVLQVICGAVPPSAGRLLADERALGDLSVDDRGVVLVQPGDVLAPAEHTIALFDEPLAGRDASQRAAMADELKQLHARLGTTFIYATRDQGEALRVSDRIAVLHNGSVQQVGTPRDLVERPRNTFVASYFGDPPMNVVPGILEKDGIAVEIGPRALQLNGVVEETFVRDVFLGVRPEHVRLSPDAASGWQGTVAGVESRGDRTTVEVRVDGGCFIACGDNATSHRPGDRVAVQMAAKHLHVFDERGDRLDVV